MVVEVSEQKDDVAGDDVDGDDDDDDGGDGDDENDTLVMNDDLLKLHPPSNPLVCYGQVVHVLPIYCLHLEYLKYHHQHQ